MSTQKTPVSRRQQRTEARLFIDSLQGVSFPDSHHSRSDNLSVEVCND